MRILGVLLMLCSAVCSGEEPVTVEGLLADATLAAQRARDPQARAICMAQIACAWSGLNQGKYEQAAADALAFATASRTEMARVMALRGVAVRIARVDQKKAQEALAEAHRLATELASDADKAVALRELLLAAMTLKQPDVAELMDEARTASDEVSDPLLRAACLRDLGAGLATDWPDKAGEAFSAAQEALAKADADETTVRYARAEIAAAWAPLDIGAATEIINQSEDATAKSIITATVARPLAAKSPDRALALAYELPEGPPRAYVIGAGAAGMGKEFASSAESLARASLAMLANATGEAADQTRGDIAVALAWSSADEAVEVAKTISDPDIRDGALAAVAERVGETDPRAAIALLQLVDAPIMAEPVMARLAVKLAEVSPEDAFETTRDILSRRWRVDALVGIVGVLRAQSEEQ